MILAWTNAPFQGGAWLPGNSILNPHRMCSAVIGKTATFDR